MRAVILLLGLAVTGCAVKASTDGMPRPEVLRDMEGYAIASCLVLQPLPYFKDQGDAWASVIIQRMKGSPDVLAGIVEQVKLENKKGDMAVIRDEAESEQDKVLPVLYCNEIIDRPAVRAAIQKAVDALKPSYRQ